MENEKEKENQKKRSYTVPVLLIILTLMSLVIVILLSRYLVQQQQDWLEDGKWLAEKYEDAAQFAQSLQTGADKLLGSAGAQDAEGRMLLAQAVAHSRNFVDLMAEAESRDKKIRVKEAREHYASEMELFQEKLGAAREGEAWLSGQDRQVLEAIREEASKMSEELQKFRLPTVDSGFRMMAAGQGWLEPALAASESWANLMSRLQ